MCANTEIKLYCGKIAKRYCVLLSVTADKGALLYFCCCDINTDQKHLRRKWFIWLTLPCQSQGRGTQGRSPEAGSGAETWKGAAYRLIPHGLLTLLLTQPRTPCPEWHYYNDLGPLTSISSQENVPQTYPEVNLREAIP